MTTSKNDSSACSNPIAELLEPLAQGQLGAEDSGRVLDHLERCSSCSRELDFLADLVTAIETPRAASEPAAPGRIHRFPFGLLGGLAAAAAILFLVVPLFLGEGSSITDLADFRRPAYTDVRGIDEDRFVVAMAGYNDGRDSEVEAQLTELIEGAPRSPDARPYYYRAAVRVALGRPSEARDDLDTAATLAEGALRDHVLWRLANVHLLLEDAEAALSTLSTLASGDGPFKGVAETLSTEVRSAKAR